MRERVVEAGGFRVVCLDDGDCDDSDAVTVLYAHMGVEHAHAVYALLPLGARPVLAAITDAEWTRDLSPWPAPGLTARSAPFAGGAAAHLTALASTVVPAVEAQLALRPAHRGLVGYSLDGLFALYAASHSPLFDLCASVSGSLWYDGFVDDLEQRLLHPCPDSSSSANSKTTMALHAAYLSLGRREQRNARNARMRTVGAATERAHALLAAAGVRTVFELNPGSHYDDVPARIAHAIIWLCGSCGDSGGGPDP